jgi:hypothetical protein
MGSKSVAVLLKNPAHWHLRAQEAHLLASHLEDQEAKAATLKIAAEYERLARARFRPRLSADEGQFCIGRSPPIEADTAVRETHRSET